MIRQNSTPDSRSNVDNTVNKRFHCWKQLCLLLIFAGLTCLTTGCRTSAIRHLSPPEPAINRLRSGGSIQAEVDYLVQPLIDSREECGLVAGVITPNGATQTFCYGSADKPGAAPAPNADSIFQVGSVSKLFLTVLFEKLAEEGRLNYNDTLGSILPASAQASADARNITLYELATHMSGLPREPIQPVQFSSLLRYMLAGHNLYSYLNKDYLYRYLRHVHTPPREKREFVYSNLGIGLLANLIEIKTGQSVTNLIVEEIIRPLGLKDTGFVLNKEQNTRLIQGHVGNQACWKLASSSMPPWDLGEILNPSGGMYSTPNDLLLFAKAHLHMLPTPLAPVLDATHRTQILTPRGGEALGWILQNFEDGSTLTFKDGMIGGYCSYIGLDLDRKVAVVVLHNQFSWDEKVGHNLLRRLSGYYNLCQPGALSETSPVDPQGGYLSGSVAQP